MDALNLLTMMREYGASLAPEEEQHVEQGLPLHSLEAYQRLLALRLRLWQHSALGQLLRDVHGGKEPWGDRDQE